jgi:hypothetical protein
VIEGHVGQREVDEIKARYGIGGRAAGPGRFPIVFIKPSHYDDDGYVIQWWRPASRSNSLAVLHEMAESTRQRKVLGDKVEMRVKSMDEESTHIRTDRLAREMKDGRGLVILTGVQSSQFPRAMDLALPLRVAGVHVCMGGFHISGSISMAGGITPELREAMNLGISLYAGEAEQGRLDQVVRDAWRGELKPLYNYLGDLPSAEGDPSALLKNSIRGTIGRSTKPDAGPPQFSFSTIHAVPGQEPRPRTVEEVEEKIRENLQQGVGRFFITDDNFSWNPDWEKILDRLIEMREQEKLDIQLMVQVDATCDQLPGFIEKAGRAGVRRVFVGLESLHAENPQGAKATKSRIAEYREMLLEWKRAGVIVFAGYIFGLPGETRESVLRDIRIMQRELPVDLLEPYCLTALPGSEGDEKPRPAAPPQATMTTAEWDQVCRDAWKEYYTPEHMETVLRRGAATGIPLSEMMALLLWFHTCVVYEKVDPLQGGYLRRKYRTDRRRTMPKEKLLLFYRRYSAELIYQQCKMAQLSWHFRRFVKQLEREPGAKTYMDGALTRDGG